MKVAEIEIHAGEVDQPYKTVGEISAKVQAATAFSKTPTLEDINLKLQEKAVQMGANAVINVKYGRGMSLTSYTVLRATGVAVVLGSDEIKCPYCAELVKGAAVKCKHCGSELTARAVADSITIGSATYIGWGSWGNPSKTMLTLQLDTRGLIFDRYITRTAVSPGVQRKCLRLDGKGRNQPTDEHTHRSTVLLSV